MIELGDLIGLHYDLGVTQDGLKCWRMGFILCGKHPLLLTRIQVSDPGPMAFLFYIIVSHRSEVELGCTIIAE